MDPQAVERTPTAEGAANVSIEMQAEGMARTSLLLPLLCISPQVILAIWKDWCSQRCNAFLADLDASLLEENSLNQLEMRG